MDWRRIPSLAALRAFEAAARTGSMTAAAAELNVTQAAISQHVHALERAFGCDLMVRRGRGLTLTPEGQALAEGLGAGFRQIADSVAALQSAGAARPLSVTLTPSFAEHWLMPRLGKFWIEHPEIELALWPAREVRDMAADGIDLAIRFGRGTWPGLTAEPLVSAEFVVVGAPSLVPGGAATPAARLADLPWAFDADVDEFRLWAQSQGILAPTSRAQNLPTNELALSLSRAGHALSVQPAALVEADLKLGTLVEVRRADPVGLNYYMVTRPGRVSPRLVAFMAWLRKVA